MKDNVALESLKEQAARDYRDAFSGIVGRGFDFQRIAGEFYSEERAAEQVELIRSLVPFPLEGKRLLEVGSAYGVFLHKARELTGAETYGVEPAPSDFSGTLRGAAAYLRLKGSDARLIGAVGEELPFGNSRFDVVCSYNVLEHVQNPARVLGEIARVLAPGGCAVVVAPNYGSWWEGHYGILWPAHCPKALARLYVRLHGRDPKFLDTIHLLTVRGLRKALAPRHEEIEVLSWGRELWEQRLIKLDIADWAALGRLKRMVQLLHRLRLHRFMARLGGMLNWQTPIVLVFRKK